MNRTDPKPTRLTMAFYAAFAASFVQGRYTSPDLYRWLVGEVFQVGLHLLALTAFLILTLGALVRSLRAASLPWRHAAAAIGALVMAELIWRYGVNNLPGYGFKDVAIVVHLALPVVVALGAWAIISERKGRIRDVQSHSSRATA